MRKSQKKNGVTVGTQQRWAQHCTLCCRKCAEWTDCLECREEKIVEEKKTGSSGSSSWLRSRTILASRSQGQQGGGRTSLPQVPCLQMLWTPRAWNIHARSQERVGHTWTSSHVHADDTDEGVRCSDSWMHEGETPECRKRHPCHRYTKIPSPWHPNGQPPPCSLRCLVALPSAAAAGAQWTRLDTLRSKKIW